MRLVLPYSQSLGAQTSLSKYLGEEVCVVATIGNFDGIHLGHQALFARLKEEAARVVNRSGKTAIHVLVSFHPHPRVVLGGISAKQQKSDPSYWSLTPLRAKAEAGRRDGFEYFYPIRFRRELAELSPEAFAKTYFHDILGAQLIVVGYDWRFGKGRAGDSNTLEALGKDLDFEVCVVEPVLVEGKRVSSSLIRDLLAKTDLSQLKVFLGRDFSVCGKVVHGKKRGRSLGFPTANIIPSKQLLPVAGVYATRVRLEDGRLLSAVSNVGVRPTFDGDSLSLETHILDTEGLDLYGTRIEVLFKTYIREEKKFSGVEALKAQVKTDITYAREYLASNS